MKLSVFFFSSADRGAAPDRYSFILETAVLAEDLGFEAIWMPERHFHSFGGLFPSPAVLAAALATRTNRIGLRAGSVVMPLHHVARVAEEWAMVDALSNGRAGLSLATGWNRGDFVLGQVGYEQRREHTFATVDTLRALWRGEELALSPDGELPPVRTYPAPMGRDIPLWLTAMSGPATFEEAARRGCRVLTAYLQQDRSQVERNVRVYREAFSPASPGGRPHVTLMMHACVTETAEQALAAVERPLITYQREFLDLHDRTVRAGDLEELTEEEKDELASYAARKYAAERGLIGGREEVAARLDDLASIGVDEVACLVDFGLEPELVFQTLKQLAVVTSPRDRESPSALCRRTPPAPGAVRSPGARSPRPRPS
ncbi:MupA/Atu3671 family FMN-dependent luciferase-like monooxygenase [Nonomuraea sp. NPDC050786]|uniref:MupA/Atu3671 family FMN-dependent luciferase-like monooxygenase n=1 Tax=Nonomuraea sp. NPDC050786 TaxID=3154840 RepID=UPI0033CB9AF2